ncbi:WCX domain-containing protein [Lachnoanaerobaculum gingivalis]
MFKYGPYVEVLEPESLRNRIKEDISYMSKRYSG